MLYAFLAMFAWTIFTFFWYIQIIIKTTKKKRIITIGIRRLPNMVHFIVYIVVLITLFFTFYRG